MDTLSLTKEARIYNGVKTISLTSGAGKPGQPLVNETRTLFFFFFVFLQLEENCPSGSEVKHTPNM